MFAAAATAAEGCGSQKICIQSVPGPAGAELHAVNRESFPVTLIVDLTLNNLVPAGAMPSQWVLPPGEPVPLLQLRVADPQQPWDYSYRLSWARGDFRVQHDDSYVYSLPYRPGSGFLVSQSYNGRFSHHGDSRYAIDFAMPEGTPVVAAREGTVVAVRSNSTVGGPNRKYEDAANYVVIEHADGTFGEYLHLYPHSVRVQPGERVRRGQLLALSGNTGFSSGPHLHFMVSGATADGARRSFPVRFSTTEGIVAELQMGREYLHGAEPLPPGENLGVEGLANTKTSNEAAAGGN